MNRRKITFYCLLLCVGGLGIYSCNNDSANAEAAKQDSILKAKNDSLTKAKKIVEDSISYAKSLDSIKSMGVMKFDTSSLTCDSMAKLMLAFGQVDPSDYVYITAKVNECNMQAWNQAHPEDPKAMVVYEDPTDNKILFNTISLKTGEDIAAAANVIITAVVGMETQSPAAAAVAKVISGYSVDAYLEAAKKNDPLLLIMPTAIPNVKLAKDAYKLSAAAYKEASKLHLDAPITIQVNGVKTVFSLTQKAADFAQEHGIKTINIGPVKIPVPNPNPLPASTKPKDVIKKALCPIC